MRHHALLDIAGHHHLLFQRIGLGGLGLQAGIFNRRRGLRGHRFKHVDLQLREGLFLAGVEPQHADGSPFIAQPHG